MRKSILALFFALAFSGSAMGQKIEGVWSVTEISTTGANGSVKQISQPSMYIFTKKHYSILRVSADAPRPEIDSDAATAEDLRKIFVDGFVANAGSYELKGGKLTTRPMIAKNPGVMKSGTFTTSSVKMEGTTLTLVTESSNSGPARNPTTTKLRRVE